MSNPVENGKCGKKGVAGTNVASREGAGGPQVCGDDLPYVQTMSADCECLVPAVPKAGSVRNSAVAESDNSRDEVDRATARAYYCPREGTGHQRVGHIAERSGINVDSTNKKNKRKNRNPSPCRSSRNSKIQMGWYSKIRLNTIQQESDGSLVLR